MKTKVFLRNRETGLCYAGATGWIRHQDGAHDFGVVEDAVEFARNRRFLGVEVVLHYEDPVCDLVLPISEN